MRNKSNFINELIYKLIIIMSVSYDKCEIHDEVENLICFDQGCEYFNKLSCKVCHNSQPHIAREVEVFYKEWA